MANSNELVLKPIGELLGESFYIPAYQRGYRWSEREVIELLEDIKEFQQQSEEGSKDAFYCLQPIVVKDKDGEWELVDGQQRLTTINIILVYLKEIAALLGKSCYSIRYETRPNSEEFLKDIDSDRKDENIDFHHICEARDAIENWFENLDGTYKLKFLQTLLNDNETGKNVKVIWYQINEQIDAAAVFSRLNVGKIPLTNAELVKALFLRSSNFNGVDSETVYLNQLKTAQEWDGIEKQLQDDEFWYFISNKSVEANRIEFVLNLVAEDLPGNNLSRRDPLFIFLSFNKHLLEKDSNTGAEWLTIKRYFMTLYEWFSDRKLFHLIGFLVCQRESIGSLMKLYLESNTKNEFQSTIIELIFKKVFSSPVSLANFESLDELVSFVFEGLEQLTYESPRSRLVTMLLMFNISSLLSNPTSNARFQFNRFKLESWDIEHIRSVASDMPTSKDKQKVWLENVKDYISTTDMNIAEQSIRTDAVSLLREKTFNSQMFEVIYNKVLDLYDPNGDEEIDQSIGNLTLLDSSTNRSYQNAVFPIKRARIISLDKKATFVPLCTKNAFLKYYSQQVDKMMFWESRDSQDHQQAMAETLVNFFNRQGGLS